MDTDFQPIGCSRCNEVVCYIPADTPLNNKLKMSVVDLFCWQCTQRVKKSTRPVIEIPRPTSLIPPDGPRAA
jgi:hypothetical protein